jgi:hypothetical protein
MYRPARLRPLIILAHFISSRRTAPLAGATPLTRSPSDCS